jgi:hypothetical protein
VQPRSPADASVLAREGPRVAVRLRSPSGEAAADGSALLDTGSERSLLSPVVAARLGLTAVGVAVVRTVGAAAAHVPEYDVVIDFPGTALPSARRRLLGIDLGEGLDVLLGRDFLVGTVLVYDGLAGVYTLVAPERAG